MRKIINISNKFYNLNDIEINSKKSELLVLNQSKKDKENGCIPEIKLEKKKEAVQVKRGKEAIRYLGVWISEKGGRECNELVIAKEVVKMCKVLL